MNDTSAELRDLTEHEWHDFAGVEDEGAQITDFYFDRHAEQAQMVAEHDRIGIHYQEPGTLDIACWYRETTSNDGVEQARELCKRINSQGLKISDLERLGFERVQ